MYQPNLLITNDLLSSYVKKFETVFSVLPDIDYHAATGRPPHPKSAILNALIFKNLRSIHTLTELSREISFYPAIAQLCGFSSIPSKERFSYFIRNTPNQFFQNIRETLLRELISLNVISGKILSTDSCPVIASAKENNLKTNVRNRFDKTKTIKGDPDARLGVYTVYPSNKKVQYFWGYRNHIINDEIGRASCRERV